MSKSSQAFCLFLDPETATDLPTEVAPQGLRYVELSGCERFTSRSGKLSRPQNGDQSIQLTSIRSKTHRSLLMTIDPGVGVTVNGLHAACFSTLNPGDVLGIDAHVLFLSLFNRPHVGPPGENLVGVKCGYCRVPIQDESDMRIYVCPNCDLPTHYQGDEVPVEKRLECAKLSSHCGHCQAKIDTLDGFTHVPKL